MRADVDALYTAALQESTRVGDATKAYADKAARDETEAHAAQVRKQVEEAAEQQAALTRDRSLPDHGRNRSRTLREAADAAVLESTPRATRSPPASRRWRQPLLHEVPNSTPNSPSAGSTPAGARRTAHSGRSSRRSRQPRRLRYVSYGPMRSHTRRGCEPQADEHLSSARVPARTDWPPRPYGMQPCCRCRGAVGEARAESRKRW